MSSKPPADPDSKNPGPDDFDSQEPDVHVNADFNLAMEKSADSNSPGTDPPEEDDDGFGEEEFSLDQLSQAYAEVLKTRTGMEVDGLAESTTVLDDQNELDFSEDDHPAETPSVDDNAGCPISPESIIESILFVGAPKDVVLNSRKMAAVLRDVSPKEVTKIVRALNAKYEQEDAAYRIESEGGVFKMVLDPKLIEFQQHFHGRDRQVRLTQAAIDVMAIVAYNQPVTREQVEKIRGKPSGSVLSQLVRRQLLNIEPGETNSKIKYFETTDRFLDLFQLEEIADLPQSHDVSDMDELAD